MPLPLTVSCFSKIQIGFTFLVPAHPGSPGQRAVKRVCVCFSVKLQSKIWMSACRIWLFVNNFGAWKMQFGSLKSAWIFYFEFATNPGMQYAHSMSSFIESDHHVPGNLEEFDCSKKLLACYKTHTNWLCPFHWFSVWIRFCTSTGKFIQLENILWILSKLSVRIVCCKIL